MGNRRARRLTTKYCSTKLCLTAAVILWMHLALPVTSFGTTIFVSESETPGKIDEVTHSSVTTFVANSSLSFPCGIAFDPNGNLYECDQGTEVVNKFTPAGVQTTFARFGTDDPLAVVCDASGNVYVVGASSESITKFSPAGNASTYATIVGGPSDLAFDNKGDLFVTVSENPNGGGGDIYEISPTGAVTTFKSRLLYPQGIAIDANNNLYVAIGQSPQESESIDKITPSGTISTFASGLDYLGGLVIDSSGDLYAADTDSGTVYEFSPGGVRTTFASGLDAPDFLAISPVPEPSSWFLAAIGIVGLIFGRRPWKARIDLDRVRFT